MTLSVGNGAHPQSRRDFANRSRVLPVPGYRLSGILDFYAVMFRLHAEIDRDPFQSRLSGILDFHQSRGECKSRSGLSFNPA